MTTFYDEDGYEWSLVMPNGEVFVQPSRLDAIGIISNLPKCGLKMVKEHRDRKGYEFVDIHMYGPRR